MDCKSLVNQLQADLVAAQNNEPISDAALHAPRRRQKSARAFVEMAGRSMFPGSERGSLFPTIQYEKTITHLRRLRLEQKAKQKQIDQKEAESFTWQGRIKQQGPWDPVQDPISLMGVDAIPIPVSISSEGSLKPFLEYLTRGGKYDASLHGHPTKAEPYYGIPYIEFEKGVLYKDRRMDMCKMVVGPEHITRLLSALASNEFVKHFLLGNNLIGPRGGNSIAKFISDYPDRISTWYLAGCCIDARTFAVVAEALCASSTCEALWLKRNPLSAASAPTLVQIVTSMKGLKVLDLDATSLGDHGTSNLFNQLCDVEPIAAPLSLQTLYLNANGIGEHGAAALGRYLASPPCRLRNLYLACNPIGDAGASQLADGLQNNTSLDKLMLQSIGMTAVGLDRICAALFHHPRLVTLDVSHAYTTADLGQRYNWIQDSAADAVVMLIQRCQTMQCLTLGITAMGDDSLRKIRTTVEGLRLCYYAASSCLSAFKGAQGLIPHFTRNIKAEYGFQMTWQRFMEEELRFMISPKEVRNIDSVYRNRDAQLAK